MRKPKDTPRPQTPLGAGRSSASAVMVHCIRSLMILLACLRLDCWSGGSSFVACFSRSWAGRVEAYATEVLLVWFIRLIGGYRLANGLVWLRDPRQGGWFG